MSEAPPRVFGIGLRKTGTRSLASACRLLDHRTLHKGGGATSALVVRSEAEGEPLLRRLGEGYDAYFDVEALVHRFAVLDAQYPGSRFILSTREEEAWLDSLERHVVANQERQARGEYRGNLVSVDRDRWRADRAEHHHRVRAYFAQRPDDLLEIDVCEAGDGWERLAPFLDRPVPSTPFPWENRDGSGTYRSAPAIARIRRLEVEARRRVVRRRS